MESRILYMSLALSVLLLTLGCSDDDGPPRPPDMSLPDAPLTTPDLDAGDGPSPQPDLPGVGEVPAEAFATFRCGVGGAWMVSAELGDLVTTGDEPPVIQEAAFLEALVSGAGLATSHKPIYDVESDTIIYLTQDRGKLVEASGVVAYPVNVVAQEFPTLLFLHGTSGFTDGCGISSAPESLLLASYIASLGYVVVAPDYIGLKAFGDPTGFLHPYLAGEPTAIASLDSVRAVHKIVRRRHPDTLVSSRVVTLGGSQGGHAALWVDWLAPYYAQELEMVGGVATVPPVDVSRQIERALREQVSATGNSIAFYATNASWYGVEGRANEVFVSREPSIPAEFELRCNPASALGGETLQGIFSPQILAAARDNALADYGIWGCMAVQNSLNRTAVARIRPQSDSYGILYVVGAEDTLVHPPLQRESFDALCARGVQLSYLECEGASHTKATAWALPEILAYLADRVAGRPVQNLCQRGPATRCEGTPE